MSRQRLTDKTAAEVGAKDPNELGREDQTNRDPGADKYENGNPSTWAEDPDTSLDVKDEHERNEMGLTGKLDAANAVKMASELQHKAINCVVASERMLPGAAESVIQANAADLMSLPESVIASILNRQEALAAEVSAAAEEVAEEAEEKEAGYGKELEEEAEEKKAGEEAEEETEEKEAGEEAEEEAEEKEAADDRMAAIEEKLAKIMSMMAGEKTEESEEEAPEAEEAPESEESEEEAPETEESEEDMDIEMEEKEASAKTASQESDLLDSIFSSVTASEKKSGATKLSGLVSKEASSKSDDLSGLWNGAPDVSSHFK
jgi:chemotaxis protein histidine kinase CheA